MRAVEGSCQMSAARPMTKIVALQTVRQQALVEAIEALKNKRIDLLQPQTHRNVVGMPTATVHMIRKNEAGNGGWRRGEHVEYVERGGGMDQVLHDARIAWKGTDGTHGLEYTVLASTGTFTSNPDRITGRKQGWLYSLYTDLY